MLLREFCCTAVLPEQQNSRSDAILKKNHFIQLVMWQVLTPPAIFKIANGFSGLRLVEIVLSEQDRTADLRQ